ncbi:MAG: diguanylate cyclase [Tepidisphaeraceae bacterium]
MHQQILLIDDSKLIHPLVTSLLANEPVTIHSALDAEYGLALAASLRPDLILLDVEMPGVDGFETCRRLKADPATASLPIIFLTARTATEEMVCGLNLGANDYVTKPFKLSELLSRVRAALRTSHLIRLLEEKALIDPLTGLGNRAMFDERFTAEVAMRIRSGSPLSCIVLDVDHFKDINDRYGHPFGDHVLSKIGEALTEICRVEDVACRHGGEEFVVLAPRTSADQAALLAERMRLAIAKIPFRQKGESITVTCSFGVAEAAGTFDRLMLERADQALYQSKEHGRDRVSIAPPQPIPRTVAA